MVEIEKEKSEIAKRLREIRIESHLSQGVFGANVGVSQDTVSLWESGKSLPNTLYLLLICKVYGVTPNYLLGFDR